MENTKIVAAPVKNRIFAFAIDSFLVYLIKVLYIHISWTLWLKNPIISFLEKYNSLFGEVNPSKITSIEISFFIKSALFPKLMLLVAGVFLISIIYNFVFFCTKWSATVGQKLLGIYNVSKDGSKIRIHQALFRSVLVVLPYFFLFLVLFYQSLAGYNIVEKLNQTTFVIALIIFVSWYDLIFITKDKLVFHDYLSSTRVILKNPDNSYKEDSSLLNLVFPDFKGMFNSLRTTIKENINRAKELKEEYKKQKNNKN